jgi:hypothetical protein
MAHSYLIGAPVYIPERRDQLSPLVREALAAVEEAVLEVLQTAVEQRDPESFLALEEALMRQ